DGRSGRRFGRKSEPPLERVGLVAEDDPRQVQVALRRCHVRVAPLGHTRVARSASCLGLARKRAAGGTGARSSVARMAQNPGGACPLETVLLRAFSSALA